MSGMTDDLAALNDLLVGVEMDRHSLPDGDAKVEALGRAIARLRGDAAHGEQKAVAEYQTRLVNVKTRKVDADGYDWRRCTREEYEKGPREGTHFAIEYRALYTRPQAALSSTAAPALRFEDADALVTHLTDLWCDDGGPGVTWEPARIAVEAIRAWQSKAAPAPVAGDAVESIAIALWHRFAPDDRIEWEDETEKAIYRDAAQQVAALAQDRASQGGAAGGVVGGWRLVPAAPTDRMIDAMANNGVKHREWVSDVYAAMLAAAPPPAAEGEVR